MIIVFIIFITVQICSGFSPIGYAVNGEDANEIQFPYLVAIFEGDQATCAGSILNRRWILTAAHCFDHGTKNLKILAGTNHLDQGGKFYSIEKGFLHEKYHIDDIGYDIGLLKVNHDISFSEAVSYIPLEMEEVPVGTPVLAAGWGESTIRNKAINNLQFIITKTIDLDTCKIHYPPSEIKDYHICTQPTMAGLGSCYGDSGGPLVAEGKVIGILNFGQDCGYDNPEVYTRIAALKSWIDETIDISYSV